LNTGEERGSLTSVLKEELASGDFTIDTSGVAPVAICRCMSIWSQVVVVVSKRQFRQDRLGSNGRRKTFWKGERLAFV
jgi:hypothetical protein